jgi:hypothetical protein
VVVRFREPSLGGAAGVGEKLGRATAVLTYMLRSRPVRAILLAKNRPALEDLLASLLRVLDHIETELGPRRDILPERWTPHVLLCRRQGCGSGSALFSGCLIRIRIKMMRIRNPGRRKEFYFYTF